MKIAFYTATKNVKETRKMSFVPVKTFWTNISPEQVFVEMQGENWSPNGEARQTILKSGASHTSMSVGDYVYDSKSDIYYKVEPLGFRVCFYDSLLDFVKGESNG